MDAFWAQLWASLAGAVVGIAGVWLAFWLQRSAARRDSADTAAAEVIAALGRYASGRESQGFEAQWAVLNRSPNPPRRLNHEEPAIALDILLIASPKRERVHVHKFVRAFGDIKRGSHDVVGGLRWLARAMTLWRTDSLGELSLDEHIHTAVQIATEESLVDGETIND